MDRLSGDRPVPLPLRGAVVALGNFDGFHVGHQAVAGRAIARARAEGRPAIVATFDPHPARLFRPETPPFLLTTIAQRLDLFEAFGADGGFVLPFDRAMAALPPERFIDEWLVGRVGAATVVTGEDFTFGRDRSGRIAMLGERLAGEAVAAVAADGGTASSSRVRAALAEGDMAAARRLLTRPFTIAGTVIHGDKRGRTIGYPTANMTLGDYQRPAYGIYAVRGRLDDGRVLDGVANLGIRPQFEEKELLEPFFFDFDGDLYGRRIAVELIARIRPEARFDSLDALVARMDADAAEARRILAADAPAH